MLDQKARTERKKRGAWEKERGENDEALIGNQALEGSKRKENSPPKNGRNRSKKDPKVAVARILKVSCWKIQEKSSSNWPLKALKVVPRLQEGTLIKTRKTS